MVLHLVVNIKATAADHSGWCSFVVKGQVEKRDITVHPLGVLISVSQATSFHFLECHCAYRGEACVVI